MKKLLLLGGSYQQIPAIETAKHLGYFTVLCDYLPDNPGQYHADKFYQVSTTDREAVLKVANDENIDGIIAYASDPAAPTAAFVAETLGRPGNPLKSVETLCSKDLFRAFLAENGFDVPVSAAFSKRDDALGYEFSGNKIVKPVDSSGSKGVTVVTSREDYEAAVDYAFSFSRSGRIIVEDYVEKNHPYIIGGDIFVVGGEVNLWGLMNCHRDPRVNPLVPVGKSYPCDVDGKSLRIARRTLSRLVEALGIKNGPMNVELIVDREGRCFILDAGPRAGGNMIPELLSMIFGCDLVELSVRLAMGDENVEINTAGTSFYATHNIHSQYTGILDSIDFHPFLAKNIVKTCLYAKKGDHVSFFDYASKALGIIFLKFDSAEEMYDTLDNVNRYVTVRVKESEIGGYFGLEPLSGRSKGLCYDGPYWPDSARNALVLLLDARSADKVYIPRYLCESVSNVLIREDIPFEYYEVGADFRPVFDKKLKDNEYLYVVNYFGQLSEEEILNIRDKHTRVIVDNVQAFFTPPLPGVDTVYSCRKFFGVPDGAYIETTAEIREVPLKSSSLEAYPYLTGRKRDGASAHYAEFKSHDKALADAQPSTADMITLNMLSRIDYEAVREAREKNYAFLADKLDSINKLKLRAPAGPYCYPFYSESASSMRGLLAEHKIYVPTLWQNVIESFPGTVEANLAEKILPLPCDQRYDESDMSKIIDIIKKKVLHVFVGDFKIRH